MKIRMAIDRCGGVPDHTFRFNVDGAMLLDRCQHSHRRQPVPKHPSTVRLIVKLSEAILLFGSSQESTVETVAWVILSLRCCVAAARVHANGLENAFL
jgi:hypothetical protein